MYIFIKRGEWIFILRKVNIELYEDEVNYLLTGLELFILNLNNIWAIRKDTEQQELKYAVAFYLYERLLQLDTNFEKYVNIQMPKPKKNTKKVLNFFR